jgi:DNA-binding MarR family transcriptional regulator
MKEKLTPVQNDIFLYIKEFFSKNDQLPTAPKIANHFNCASNNIVEHLDRLKLKGYIEKNEVGKYRFKR